MKHIITLILFLLLFWYLIVMLIVYDHYRKNYKIITKLFLKMSITPFIKIHALLIPLSWFIKIHFICAYTYMEFNLIVVKSSIILINIPVYLYIMPCNVYPPGIKIYSISSLFSQKREYRLVLLDYKS